MIFFIWQHQIKHAQRSGFDLRCSTKGFCEILFAFCSVILKNQTHTPSAWQGKGQSSAKRPWVSRKSTQRRYLNNPFFFFFFTQRLTGTCWRFIREINVSGPVEGNWAFSSKTSWEAHVCLFPLSVTRSPRNPPKSVKRREDCKVCVCVCEPTFAFLV